jgi:hypothetical protein
MKITEPEFQKLIAPLIGLPNCRKKVGYRKSLSFGFGEKITNPKLRDGYYGEWEIGTYNCAWRIIKDSRIVCGSCDPVDSIQDMDSLVQSIEFGGVLNIHQIGEVDFRVDFKNKISAEFFSAISDNDEVFHVFCPGNKCIEFTLEGGWEIGASNREGQ